MLWGACMQISYHPAESDSQQRNSKGWSNYFFIPLSALAYVD